MDGLEAVEIRLSEVVRNKDFRCDSGFWTTIIHKNKTLNYEKIGNLLISSQYGISIDMNEDGIGISIYRMNEINNMLCVNSVDKYAEVTEGEMSTFKLNNKDVLFNRTNSFEWVGRTGVFYKNNDSPAIFASYLVRFVPQNNRILPEYLAAFLSCEHGVKAVKGRARQSINQTNVNPEEVKEIEIPLIDLLIQRKIEHCFEVANRNIVIAEEAYQSAETLLLSHLGINDYTPNPSGVAIKTLSQSFGASGRLDSEYYQPKYEQILQAISSHHQKSLSGENGLVEIKKSIEPGSDYYGDEGIPFIRVSNLSKYEISEPDIKIPIDTVKEMHKLYPKRDTILLSKDGSVGIAHKVENDMDCVTSGAILHLTIKDTAEILPDYLTLVLNSKIVQMQAERDAGGSIIQHWKPSEISDVVIPVLDMKEQLEISDKVKESFALRKKSTELLELAKKSVEVAIEQGEDAAMKMLKEIV